MSDESPFQRASKHIWIGSLDGGASENDDPAELKSANANQLTVRAQYNPATLQVDQSVPWKKPDAATQGGTQPAGGGGAAASSSGPDNSMALEFTGAEGRSLTLELLFDAYEGGARSVDVAASVGVLERLAAVRDASSKDEKLRRPHHCLVVWQGVLKRFECVIENLSTKYSMFDTNGVPLRATCTVKLKEAKIVDKKEH